MMIRDYTNLNYIIIMQAKIQEEIKVAAEPPLVGEIRICGKVVKAGWTKGMEPVDYRMHIFQAFNRAQSGYEIRKQEKAGKVNADQKRQLEAKIRECEAPLDNKTKTQLSDQFKIDVVPSLPLEDRMKLVKFTQSCTKKHIERYFNIDSASQAMVYYGKQTDKKPKKSVDLKECIIKIESKQEYDKLSEEERKSKESAWNEATHNCRVAIITPQRKNKPVYTYASSKEQAIAIKMLINNALSSVENKSQLKSLINYVANADKLNNFKSFYSQTYLPLVQKMKNLKKQAVPFAKLSLINDNFGDLQKNALQIFASLPPAKEVGMEIVAVPAKPQIKEVDNKKAGLFDDIKSPFRYGAVTLKGRNENMLSFSVIQGLAIAKLKKIFKNRYHKRSRALKQFLESKDAKSQFKIVDGQYQLHNIVKDNANRIKDLPYSSQEIQSGISSLQFDQNQIKIIEKSERESTIPLDEICYTVSNGNILQVCGRRIQPLDPAQNETMPQQLGFERVKYSRFTDKAIVKISIKHIIVPEEVQDQYRQSIARLQRFNENAFYRLKFEVGEFHCYTTLTRSNQQQHDKTYFEVNEDIEIDVQEHKYIKVSLIAIRGRLPSQNSILNQLSYEHEVSHATLKLSDFQAEAPQSCSIQLNKKLYVPHSQMIVEENKNGQVLIDPNPLIKCGIQLSHVKGSHDSAFMEGPQLLVGGYCLYQNRAVAKVLSLTRNGLATIEILKTQPNYRQLALFEPFQVQVKKNGEGDLKLIERYGISHFKAPSFFNSGTNEWQLTLNLKNKEEAEELASGINKRIQRQQVQEMYLQRTQKKKKDGVNKLVAGKLQIWIMAANNVQNASEAKVRLRVEQLYPNPQGDYLDYANDDDYMACIENSIKTPLKPIETFSVKGNQGNFSWVDPDTKPHGFLFEIGSYMQRFPHLIHLEVTNSNESLGKCTLNTEEVLSLQNFGQEIYLTLGENQTSLLRIRTLFQPSKGTIQRMKFDPAISLFQNAQQYLFYKVLSEGRLRDQYGYLIPTGDYNSMVPHKHIVVQQIPNLIQYATERMTYLQKIVDTSKQNISKLPSISYRPGSDSHFQSRYQIMQTELQDFNQRNELRPKIEENLHLFRHLWQYHAFASKNKALIVLQTQFWKQFQKDVMLSEDYQEKAIDQADFRSVIRSQFALTNEVMNRMYQRRSRAHVQVEEDNVDESMHAQFISQWEQQSSWKYSDIWNLIKYGIPNDQMRVSLWKDFTMYVVNNEVTLKCLKNSPRDYTYKDNLSVYENLKNQPLTSKFVQQIEEDMQYFRFPEGYTTDAEVREAQRITIYNILRAFSIWSIIYSQKSNKTVVYSRGMISICQRLLTFMSEEDAFWILIGLTKSLKRFFSIENSQEDKYVQNCPFVSRKICFKNDLTIINCLIKVHYPETFAHLKSLSMPLEWYFEDALSSMYTECFSSEVVMRLWDMIILSSSNEENQKRALWWLLAVPLYMIKINNPLIMRTQDPKKIKDLLLKATGAMIYSPSDFIQDLLQIIKSVFVESDTVLNRILKNDEPNQLEKLRYNVETAFLIENRQSQEATRKMAQDIIKHHPNINTNLVPGVKTQKLNGLQRVQVRLRLLSLRYIPIDESQKFAILLSSEQNPIKSQIFGVASVNEDNIDISIPDVPISVEVQVNASPINGFLSKTLTVELTTKIEGQTTSMGSVRIQVKDFLNPDETFHSLRLLNKNNQVSDDFNNPINGSVTLDFALKCQQLALKEASALPLEGFLLNSDYFKSNQVPLGISNDLIQADQNASGVKTVNEKILREITRENQSQTGITKAKLCIHGFANIGAAIQITELLNQNFTQTLLKTLALSNFDTVDTFLSKVYSLYEPNLTLGNVSVLFHHLLANSAYPLQFTEIHNALLNRTQIKSVTHQISTAVHIEAEGSFFQKLLQPSADVNANKVVDVTDIFRDTVNQLVNQTGMMGRIDLTQAPFNNIEFWLQGTPVIKRRSSVINVSLVNQLGDISVYHYLFNQDGLFQQVQGLQPFIPLSTYSDSQRLVTLPEFLDLAHNNLPVLTTVIAQDLFMKTHQMNIRDLIDTVLDETDRVYEFNLVQGRTTFNIKFNHGVDKQNDLTVNQNRRISAAQIQSLYKKQAESSFTIELSALKSQDTFIVAKQRINMIVREIVQSQNLREVPNILSEKFVVVSKRDNIKVRSFDRIRDQKENAFDLVYVEPEKNEYTSLAMYTHPNGEKEWRKCKIIKKIASQKAVDEIYNIEFEHERNPDKANPNFYGYQRENVLISYDYKASQASYFNNEIRKIIEKFGTNEGLISDDDALNFDANTQGGEQANWKALSNVRSNGPLALPPPSSNLYTNRNTGADIMFKNKDPFGAEALAELRDVSQSFINNDDDV